MTWSRRIGWGALLVLIVGLALGYWRWYRPVRYAVDIGAGMLDIGWNSYFDETRRMLTLDDFGAAAVVDAVVDCDDVVAHRHLLGDVELLDDAAPHART